MYIYYWSILFSRIFEFRVCSTYAIFRLTRKPSERINHVSRGLTVYIFYFYNSFRFPYCFNCLFKRENTFAYSNWFFVTVSNNLLSLIFWPQQRRISSTSSQRHKNWFNKIKYCYNEFSLNFCSNAHRMQLVCYKSNNNPI